MGYSKPCSLSLAYAAHCGVAYLAYATPVTDQCHSCHDNFSTKPICSEKQKQDIQWTPAHNLEGGYVCGVPNTGHTNHMNQCYSCKSSSSQETASRKLQCNCLSQLQMQGMWTNCFSPFHISVKSTANITHLNAMHHTWRAWAIYSELHSIASFFKLIITLGNRLACICFYFYQFFTCGFIKVAVLHAWYEIEELGEIALSHANGSHNLDSATVGMGGVVIQHRHWTNPSNHGRSHTTKTTWAKLICT